MEEVNVREKRTVAESATTNVHNIRMTHLNAAGRLFGGFLLQWIDELAGVVSKKHCRMNVTTASIEQLQFLRGAYLDHMVVLDAKIVYVGRTSMDVKVDSFVEEEDGERTLINRAYVTMVALDHNDKPAEVPDLFVTTDEERIEWDKGMLRKKLRNERRANSQKT